MPVTYGRTRDHNDHFWRVLFTLLVIVLVVFTLFGGCGTMVDSNEAVRVLETNGYSEVKIVDEVYAFVGWQGCGNGEET